MKSIWVIVNIDDVYWDIQGLAKPEKWKKCICLKTNWSLRTLTNKEVFSESSSVTMKK